MKRRQAIWVTRYLAEIESHLVFDVWRWRRYDDE